VSGQSSNGVSCSFFDAPAALRIQLHGLAMRHHPRLAGTINNFAILHYLTIDMTLERISTFYVYLTETVEHVL